MPSKSGYDKAKGARKKVKNPELLPSVLASHALRASRTRAASDGLRRSKRRAANGKLRRLRATENTIDIGGSAPQPPPRISAPARVPTHPMQWRLSQCSLDLIHFFPRLEKVGLAIRCTPNTGGGSPAARILIFV
jgi:hypothetical protein